MKAMSLTSWSSCAVLPDRKETLRSQSSRYWYMRIPMDRAISLTSFTNLVNTGGNSRLKNCELWWNLRNFLDRMWIGMRLSNRGRWPILPSWWRPWWIPEFPSWTWGYPGICWGCWDLSLASNNCLVLGPGKDDCRNWGILCFWRVLWSLFVIDPALPGPERRLFVDLYIRWSHTETCWGVDVLKRGLYPYVIRATWCGCAPCCFHTCTNFCNFAPTAKVFLFLYMPIISLVDIQRQTSTKEW